MRTARGLAAAALAAVVTLLGGADTAAAKDPEHAPGRTLTVTPESLDAGGSITVSGICPAGADTANAWFSRGGVGMSIADSSGLSVDRRTGRATGSLIVPTHTSAGVYQAWLACEDSELTVMHTFVVADDGPAAGASLAADGTQIAALGGGLLTSAVVAGVALAWRRHRAQTA